MQIVAISWMFSGRWLVAYQQYLVDAIAFPFNFHELSFVLNNYKPV